MEENLFKNCKQCWYYYHTNCTEDNDLIEEDLSTVICDGFEPEEYNTNTSAQPLSNKGEDIVRPILNNEGIESQDKEPVS